MLGLSEMIVGSCGALVLSVTEWKSEVIWLIALPSFLI